MSEPDTGIRLAMLTSAKARAFAEMHLIRQTLLTCGTTVAIIKRHLTPDCAAAWKKDPLSGVIGA